MSVARASTVSRGCKAPGHPVAQRESLFNDPCLFPLGSRVAGSRGVSNDFSDTRESPPSIGGIVFGRPCFFFLGGGVVVSQKWSCSTGLGLSFLGYPLFFGCLERKPKGAPPLFWGGSLKRHTHTCPNDGPFVFRSKGSSEISSVAKGAWSETGGIRGLT